jgi:hypothetical protein
MAPRISAEKKALIAVAIPETDTKPDVNQLARLFETLSTSSYTQMDLVQDV